MRRQLRYDLLAAAGASYGVGLGILFEWPMAFVMLTAPAVALVALTRWRLPSSEVAAVARTAWIGPTILGVALVFAFNGSWEAGLGWDRSGFTGFDVAQFGLVATFGASLGIAAMARPRPRHTWAVSPLVGSLVYGGLFFVWLLVAG